MDLQARAIIDSYVLKHGLVRHQIESFTYFVSTLLPLIVQENSTVTVHSEQTTHTLRYSNVFVPRPMAREMTGFCRNMHSPQEALLRGMTYSSPVLVDVEHTVLNRFNQTRRTTMYRNLQLCSIPVMVKSPYCVTSVCASARRNHCAHEHGGYFIINSNEKGMISQEKLCVNAPFVWPGRSNTKTKYVCEIRSCHHNKLRSTSTLYINIRDRGAAGLPEVTVQIPFVDVAVPLAYMFYLLGAADEEDMLNCICPAADHEMAELASVVLRHDPEADVSREALLEWLACKGTTETLPEKRARYMQHIMASEVLPHQGLDTEPATLRQKKNFVGFMVNRLLRVYLQRCAPDERDAYATKRVDTAGALCSLLFRQLFRHYLKTQHASLQRCADTNKPVDVPHHIMGRKITAGLNYAFATGSWGMQKQGSATQGICQLINRNSFVAAVSNLRRVNTPVNKDSKSASVRQLHSSSWGVVCPTETPEGQCCGLTKNLALLAHIRVGCRTDIPLRVMRRCQPLVRVEDVSAPLWEESWCFVNGILVGWTADAGAVIARLRADRRNGALPYDATVAHYRGNVHLNTDPGALCRPVLVTAQLHLLAPLIEATPQRDLFETLKSRGVIQYLEKLEESEYTIAVDLPSAQRTDAPFVEIHPSVILGLCASLIPCCDFNQSPRNTYQSAMGKQSCGTWLSNYLARHDTVAYSLCYPQKPLVHTWTDQIAGLNKLPAGQNLFVAIGSYGFNMEDSIVVNRAWIDRGGGRAYVYRSVSEQESPSGNDVFKLERPDQAICKKHACYDKLNADGVVDINEAVEPGTALIGKTVESYRPGTSERVKKDCSHVCKHSGVVDQVVRTINRDGLPLIRVRTRSLRRPMIGDKFTSRHGQKGIIGKVLEPEDMPFNAQGISPDIIVNPHAVPSRMTVGHLLEALLGTAACISGEFADGTPFRNIAVHDVARVLEGNFKDVDSVDAYGNMTTYSGVTGAQLTDKLCYGNVYYQRLKHMAADKVRAPQPSAAAATELCVADACAAAWPRGAADQAAAGGSGSRRRSALRRDGGQLRAGAGCVGGLAGAAVLPVRSHDHACLRAMRVDRGANVLQHGQALFRARVDGAPQLLPPLRQPRVRVERADAVQLQALPTGALHGAHRGAAAHRGRGIAFIHNVCAFAAYCAIRVLMFFSVATTAALGCQNTRSTRYWYISNVRSRPPSQGAPKRLRCLLQNTILRVGHSL
jgi:DNA-directed RNA polymerase II subunit RPB2